RATEQRLAKAFDSKIPRTAIVMPVFNEDVERVYLGLRQTCLSLQQTGLTPFCDVYLLCDTTEPAIQQGEQEVIEKLKEEFSDRQEIDAGSPTLPPRVELTITRECVAGARADDGSSSRPAFRLIRRTERTKFKAGNIANFLVQYGGAYDYMLVLDADSVMLGQTVRR